VADIMGKIMTFKIGMLGHHWVMNSLAVLGAVELAGADLGLAGLELAEMQPLKGRGRRHQIMIDPMMDASFLLIDESYNANPASMAAAIATLGEVDVSRGAVKIAVLGDMGELGDLAKNFHLDLGGLLEKSGISRLYAVGEYMSLLAETLPASITGKIFKNSIDLVASLKYEIRTGDVVMVKGSNASGMNFVVDKMLEIDHNALLENSRSA
jgi:UDP-N-acetylmuramoyl-tripeptide--D-alanyl-D-alanine ligase